jgi:hypothetical protein
MTAIPFVLTKALTAHPETLPDGEYDAQTQRWSVRDMATTWCKTTTTGDAMSGTDPDQEEDDERDTGGW